MSEHWRAAQLSVSKAADHLEQAARHAAHAAADAEELAGFDMGEASTVQRGMPDHLQVIARFANKLADQSYDLAATAAVMEHDPS